MSPPVLPEMPPVLPTSKAARLDSLRSLYGTIHRARSATEAYIIELQAEEDANPDTTYLRPRISKLETVLRDFQKVEKLFVQEDDEPTRQAGIFDLQSARAEIERRLAGLAELLEQGDPAG